MPSAPRLLQRRPWSVAVRAVVVLVVLTLAGCGNGSSAEPAKRLEPSDAVQYQTGLTYYADDKVELKVDACLPPGTGTARKAALVVHGGAFVDGSRSSGGMRGLCTLLARQGVAAFSVDYRLAPTYIYPTQVTDLGNAVAWLRQAAQVTRFNLDPAHVGVVGSSAGAILAQSVGTLGTGPRDQGKRVSAVVSLSGVSLMTEEGLELGTPTPRAESLILNYLGCDTVQVACPQARKASPITGVDATDPPMLLVNGSDELVPAEQAEAMSKALKTAKVPVSLVVVDGDSHGAALLNADVRRSMQAFLDKHL